MGKKVRRNSKIVSTSFNNKELAIIHSVMEFLARNRVLPRPTYYSFLRLAVFRLIDEINNVLLKTSPAELIETLI